METFEEILNAMEYFEKFLKVNYVLYLVSTFEKVFLMSKRLFQQLYNFLPSIKT